jgi:hypothetical protein
MYSDNNCPPSRSSAPSPFSTIFTTTTTPTTTTPSVQPVPFFGSSDAQHGAGSGPHLLMAPHQQVRTLAQREGRPASRSYGHQHNSRARSRPYVIKPIQKRTDRARREVVTSTPTRSPSRGALRTPNLFLDQQQERPSNATPLSSSGQIQTPVANFEASFDGVATFGFEFDTFGSNERLMASATLYASS